MGQSAIVQLAPWHKSQRAHQIEIEHHRRKVRNTLFDFQLFSSLFSYKYMIYVNVGLVL